MGHVSNLVNFHTKSARRQYPKVFDRFCNKSQLKDPEWHFKLDDESDCKLFDCIVEQRLQRSFSLPSTVIKTKACQILLSSQR